MRLVTSALAATICVVIASGCGSSKQRLVSTAQATNAFKAVGFWDAAISPPVRGAAFFFTRRGGQPPTGTVIVHRYESADAAQKSLAQDPATAAITKSPIARRLGISMTFTRVCNVVVFYGAAPAGPQRTRDATKFTRALKSLRTACT